MMYRKALRLKTSRRTPRNSFNNRLNNKKHFFNYHSLSYVPTKKLYGQVSFLQGQRPIYRNCGFNSIWSRNYSNNDEKVDLMSITKKGEIHFFRIEEIEPIIREIGNEMNVSTEDCNKLQIEVKAIIGSRKYTGDEVIKKIKTFGKENKIPEEYINKLIYKIGMKGVEQFSFLDFLFIGSIVCLVSILVGIFFYIQYHNLDTYDIIEILMKDKSS